MLPKPRIPGGPQKPSPMNIEPHTPIQGQETFVWGA